MRSLPRPRRTRRDVARDAGITAADWLDERLSPAGGLRWLLWRKIPKGSDNFAYTLGVAALFAFLSQAVTGLVLAMYHDPSPTGAYESVPHITRAS